MPARSLARALPAALLASALAGCGFEPLHGAATSEALEEIEVAPIHGSAGELLHAALTDRLHPRAGRRGAPVYRLEVTLEATSSPLVIDQTTFVRRYDVHLEARYRLTEVATGREIGAAAHSAHANHGVIPNEIYGTLVSSRAALRRAANVLASVIVTDAALLLRTDRAG